MLKDADQMAIAQAYDDINAIAVKGHDDCLRVARALEAIGAVLRADATERDAAAKRPALAAIPRAKVEDDES